MNVTVGQLKEMNPYIGKLPDYKLMDDSVEISDTDRKTSMVAQGALYGISYVAGVIASLGAPAWGIGAFVPAFLLSGLYHAHNEHEQPSDKKYIEQLIDYLERWAPMKMRYRVLEGLVPVGFLGGNIFGYFMLPPATALLNGAVSGYGLGHSVGKFAMKFWRSHRGTQVAYQQAPQHERADLYTKWTGKGEKQEGENAEVQEV